MQVPQPLIPCHSYCRVGWLQNTAMRKIYSQFNYIQNLPIKTMDRYQTQDLHSYLTQTQSNRNSTDYQSGLVGLSNDNFAHYNLPVNALSAKSYIQELKQTHEGYQTTITQETNYRSSVEAAPSMDHRGVVQSIPHASQAIMVVKREDVDAAWRVTCSQLEKQVHELQVELGSLRGAPQTFEKVSYIEDTARVNSLVSDNDRLNRVIIDLNNEIKQWTQKYASLQQNITARQSLDMEVERMRAVLQDNESILQSEILRLRDQVGHEQSRYVALEQELLSLKQGEYKIASYEQFIVTLQGESNQKEDEKKRLKQNIESYETQFLVQSEELKKVRVILDDRNREIEALKRPDSTNVKAKQLQDELQRLSQLLRQKDEELVRLKQTQVRLQSQDGGNVNILKTENQRLNDRVQQLEEEIQKLIAHIDGHGGGGQQLLTTQQDVGTWKDKFVALNREYHKIQETLMMTQAELENVVRRSQTNIMMSR